MIRNSFSFLNGITEKFERSLWRSGIVRWEDFCHREKIYGINPEKKRLYDAQLAKMSVELQNKNSEFFSSIIRKQEHWKLFDEFKDGAICLDIETNGLPFDHGGYIT
ncbi:MAG: hypothetical protein N2511_02535, partial [Thermodesulfovibrionales bacterium]|nr:hypothetical protein [Thermodesulfovibrionales bacterium]